MLRIALDSFNLDYAKAGNDNEKRRLKSQNTALNDENVEDDQPKLQRMDRRYG